MNNVITFKNLTVFRRVPNRRTQVPKRVNGQEVPKRRAPVQASPRHLLLSRYVGVTITRLTSVYKRPASRDGE